jgi:hypothetical protein
MSSDKTDETKENNAVQFPEGGADGKEPTLEQKVDFLISNHLTPQQLQGAFDAINKDIKLIALRQENLELKLLRPDTNKQTEDEPTG